MSGVQRPHPRKTILWAEKHSRGPLHTMTGDHEEEQVQAISKPRREGRAEVDQLKLESRLINQGLSIKAC